MVNPAGSIVRPSGMTVAAPAAPTELSAKNRAAHPARTLALVTSQS
jgi:hypothetical protein